MNTHPPTPTPAESTKGHTPMDRYIVCHAPHRGVTEILDITLRDGDEPKVVGTFSDLAEATKFCNAGNACKGLSDPAAALAGLVRLARLFKDLHEQSSLGADRDIPAFRARWDVPDGTTVAVWCDGEIRRALSHFGATP